MSLFLRPKTVIMRKQKHKSQKILQFESTQMDFI